MLYIHKAAEFPDRAGTASNKVFCEGKNNEVLAPELVSV
jgi:hypothetical protein